MLNVIPVSGMRKAQVPVTPLSLIVICMYIVYTFARPSFQWSTGITISQILLTRGV